MKKIRFSNLIWGTFMLLIAAFVLSKQFGGFVEIGLWSVIVAALAVAFIIQCIAHLTLAQLPIPFAVLYIIFQEPLGLPDIQSWTLILAAVFATIGLSILFPKRHIRKDNAFGAYNANRQQHSDHSSQTQPEGGDYDNNPSVSVNFGGISRYLHADCLETAQLHCCFGGLEIYFDQTQLSPYGAEVSIDCSFGAVELFVPGHWRVIDKLACTLGGVDIDHRRARPEENAPVLTLTGSVSFGGVEVKFV